jgi:hypothetical protein
MTCSRAQGFLARTTAKVTETTDARTVRFDGVATRKLLKEIQTVVAMRGKSLVRTTPGELDAETLNRLVLGPTGNLRAPAARIGKTLLVGFDEPTWKDALG